MGGNHSSQKSISFDANADVTLDHFQILRAIGKGSFGKVCIVQKKDTKKMFAMKYMNKAMCIEKDAVQNVMREVELLASIDHPFLVNLWYTFQDSEDMFMVVDLLLGGDLRYHIQQEQKFDEARVKLYICEIALVLDYLQSQNILHRDLKPDNMLLDEEGHIHITDFNVAVVLEENELATSMTGTKPYMAPEVFACALEECPGYHFAADWWSLGVCAYEMLRGKRPYDIQCSTSCLSVKQMFASTYVSYPSQWEDGMCHLLNELLTLDPSQRLCSLNDLKRQSFLHNVDFNAVLSCQIKPAFIPSKDHLNCDPTYELEEMIIEAKPLHKKKKRLAKQNSKKQKSTSQGSLNSIGVKWIECLEGDFKPYNRERDLLSKKMEKSEEEESNIECQTDENRTDGAIISNSIHGKTPQSILKSKAQCVESNCATKSSNS